MAVVAHAMRTEPSERFQTAEEMSEALAPWLNLDAASTSPPASSPAAFAPTVVPWTRR